MNGFQLSEGHPDCSASLDGSPQDVLNPKGMQQYDAAVRGNEEQVGRSREGGKDLKGGSGRQETKKCV